MKSSGKDSSTYEKVYEEAQVIGRGNFGAAMLVKHRSEGKEYIAKKVNLSGLSAKEQEGCMMEFHLLKNLDHPNIVGYKESFLTSNQLIIVMEYCEGNGPLYLSSFACSRRHGLPHQEETRQG